MRATTTAIALWSKLLLFFHASIAGAEEMALETTTAKMFSQEWMDEFGKGNLGCTGPAIYPYGWTDAGYGSNINYLLLAWVNAIAEGNNDLTVVTNTERDFTGTECQVASDGAETRRGWPCIFAEMPHLCAFADEQEWVLFNSDRGLSDSEQHIVSRRNSYDYWRGQLRGVEASISALDGNVLDVVARLYDYLDSHLQPWFKADVQAILDEPAIAAMRGRNYVGMHIRHKPKETSITPTEEYFANVVKYLDAVPGGLAATDISGLWLSTDKPATIDEVKVLAPRYFPNVTPDEVVCATFRVPMRAVMHGQMVRRPASRNAYDALVLLRAELEMLADADVFSGTFTSNLGRVVALMRHTKRKPPESTLSGDVPTWYFPGR